MNGRIKMKRIIRSRGNGKTYDLIKYSIENDCTIICATTKQCKSIEDMALKYFGTEVKTCPIYRWEDFSIGKVNKKYTVDELEMVAQFFIGGEMCGYSMSME